MSVFRTSNPLLTADSFSGKDGRAGNFGNFNLGPNATRGMAVERPTTMTLQGAVNASMILLGLCVAAGVFVFSFLQTRPGILMPGALGGSLLTLGLTLLVYFKPGASPFVAPVIAIAQGVFAGALSVFWSRYAAGPEAADWASSVGVGLVMQAGLLTAGIAGGLLLAYKTRLIRATENFKLAVAAATTGLMFLVLATWILSMFGIRIPFIWESGPIGIAFAGAIVVLAALNLVLDFDFIEKGAEQGLPKHMEWYAAIGLLVTLVWLYVSLLRLLAMLQRRD